jgi:hypothetical protein
VQDQVAVVAGGGDVEEGQLVGALLVVAAGDFHRVAGIAQLGEVDAFDDAAGGHVEAGDDAFGEHDSSSSSIRSPLSSSARSAPRQVDGAFVDRTAADHAFDAFVLHGAQGFHVGHVVQAARGDHRDLHGLRQLDGGFDVDAAHHAVAADVGVDDGFDAVGLELLGQVDHFVAGQLAPAIGGHLAVLGVQADDDVAGKALQASCRKPGSSPRRCR